MGTLRVAVATPCLPYLVGEVTPIGFIGATIIAVVARLIVVHIVAIIAVEVAVTHMAPVMLGRQMYYITMRTTKQV